MNNSTRTSRSSQADCNIIDEATHPDNRQTAPAAACSIPPLNLPYLGVRRVDVPPSSWGAHVEITNECVQRQRLPVLSSSPLEATTCTHAGTHACNTSSPIPEGVSFDQEAACTLLTMKNDGISAREKNSKVSMRHPDVQYLIDQERFLAEQEVYMEAHARRCRLSAFRTRAPVVPGRSILAVSSTNSRSSDTADRFHANIQRRSRHGMPYAVSFGATPLLHCFAVRPGNRLHGLPVGAIRSTKHMHVHVPRGAGAL